MPFVPTPLEPVIEEKIKKEKTPKKKKQVKQQPPVGDYTTENELKSLFQLNAPPKDHKVVLETLIQLHAQEFFTQYLGDDGTFLMTKFF